MTKRLRRIVRPLLVVMAAPQFATGVWALAAPAAWHRSFPGFGMRWVAVLGPYDEHLATDVGGALIGLSAGVLVAAAFMERTSLIVALTAWLGFAIPHLVFHIFNSDPLPAVDAVIQLAALTAAVVVPIGVLLTLPRRGASAPLAEDDTSSSRATRSG